MVNLKLTPSQSLLYSPLILINLLPTHPVSMSLNSSSGTGFKTKPSITSTLNAIPKKIFSKAEWTPPISPDGKLDGPISQNVSTQRALSIAVFSSSKLVLLFHPSNYLSNLTISKPISQSPFKNLVSMKSMSSPVFTPWVKKF